MSTGKRVASIPPPGRQLVVRWTTDRLAIEALASRHAAGLLAALDHPDVGRYIGGPDVTTLTALHDRIRFLAAGPPPERTETWHNFAVIRLDAGTVIGRLEATGHHTWAEIAYVFGPAHGGRGYATEATAWLIRHLATLGVTELYAAIHPDNAPSLRLVERLGLQPCSPTRRPLTSYDPGDLVYRLDTCPTMPPAPG